MDWVGYESSFLLHRNNEPLEYRVVTDRTDRDQDLGLMNNVLLRLRRGLAPVAGVPLLAAVVDGLALQSCFNLNIFK